VAAVIPCTNSRRVSDLCRVELSDIAHASS
jgi:hypothetical protein